MKRLTLIFRMLSWWHCGTGAGRGGAADSVVQLDDDGFPVIPGKSVKGLVRDAVETLSAFQGGDVEKWFGGRTSEGRNDAVDGLLQFESALVSAEIKAGLSRAARRELFCTIGSTAVSERGTAKERSLRVREATAPLSLSAVVTGPEGEWDELIRSSMPLLRNLGSRRHRGYGRCHVEVSATEILPEVPTAPAPGNATQQWFRVTLLSDVVATASWQTEGMHESLDYIPGSMLLGAVASRGFDPERLLTGRLRFGQALPLAADGSPGVPMPLSFHRDKHRNSKLIEGSLLSAEQWLEEIRSERQPQPIRDGYYAGGQQFFVMKRRKARTAIDPERRGRSEDGQFFAFEAIQAGQQFVLPICADNPADLADVCQLLLCGGVRLGRSHSTEYGSVRFELLDKPLTSEHETVSDASGIIRVYLLSDFAPPPGPNAMLPRGEWFQMSNAVWLPERTFLRTRSFSPWNTFHHSLESSRQVICRGSVISFRTDEAPADVAARLSRGSGLHRNEGFGSVLVNPAFLVNSPSELRDTKPALIQSSGSAAGNDPLVRFFSLRAERWSAELLARKEGRALAEKLRRLAKRMDRPPSKSQWSEVRVIAIRPHRNTEALLAELSLFCTGKRAGAPEHPSVRHDAWERAMRGASGGLHGVLREALRSHPVARAARTLYYASRAVRELLESEER